MRKRSLRVLLLLGALWASNAQAQSSLIANGGFDTDLTGWLFVHLDPMTGARQAYSGILTNPEGAMRMHVPTPSSDWWSHASGALVSLSPGVPASSTVCVRFRARSEGGATFLSIGRMSGGGAEIRRIGTDWVSETACLWLPYGADELVFSLVSHDSENLQPFAPGTVLLDDVSATIFPNGSADMATNGHFESGTAPWRGQKGLADGSYVPAPEMISHALGDTPSAAEGMQGSVGALRLEVAPDAQYQYWSHAAGAVLPLAPAAPVNTTLRVRFFAKSVSGASWLGIYRAGGSSAANYVQLSTSWTEYVRFVSLSHEATELVFSLVAGDSDNAQPLAAGVALLDGIDVRIADASMLQGAGTQPVLYRNPALQSPSRGQADDLLLLSGHGFDPWTARVVYSRSSVRPPVLPSSSTAESGVIGNAALLQKSSTALTVRLPSLVQDRSYRLWVVNGPEGGTGEWSDAPATINDPRPLWISPNVAYETEPRMGTRELKVVGRNLHPAPNATTRVRLTGPTTVTLQASVEPGSGVGRYVARVNLEDPGANRALPPGSYAVAVNRDADETSWVLLPGSDVPGSPTRLQVDADPAARPIVFPNCLPDDGVDDTACFAQALRDARPNGTVRVPAGTWTFNDASLAHPEAGIVIPEGVNLEAEDLSTSAVKPVLKRGDAEWNDTTWPHNVPFFSASGHNKIRGLHFRGPERCPAGVTVDPAGETVDERLQLLLRLGMNGSSASYIHLEKNKFSSVATAIGAWQAVLSHITIVDNDVSGEHNGLYVSPGSTALFRLEDSVVRLNRFHPGRDRRTIAAQFGSTSRVDFSGNKLLAVNDAEACSKANVLEPDMTPGHLGFRAGVYFDMTLNHEQLLFASNEFLCIGRQPESAGEAFNTDPANAKFGLSRAEPVTAASSSTVTVAAPSGGKNEELLQRHEAVNSVSPFWLQVVAGPGLGQARKVVSWTRANGSVLVTVSPAWDVVPSPMQSRVTLTHKVWQAYFVGNTVDNGDVACSDPKNLDAKVYIPPADEPIIGGFISLQASTIDSVLEGNMQMKTDGMHISALYDEETKSEDTSNREYWQTTHYFTEIRGNTIQQESDQAADSRSGIAAEFAARELALSDASALAIGYGNVIAGNEISVYGRAAGAIHVAFFRMNLSTQASARNTLIFDNTINMSNPTTDLSQAPPGIRLSSPAIEDTVLDGNAYQAVPGYDVSNCSSRLVSDSSDIQSCPQ